MNPYEPPGEFQEPEADVDRPRFLQAYRDATWGRLVGFALAWPAYFLLGGGLFQSLGHQEWWAAVGFGALLTGVFPWVSIELSTRECFRVSLALVVATFAACAAIFGYGQWDSWRGLQSDRIGRFLLTLFLLGGAGFVIGLKAIHRLYGVLAVGKLEQHQDIAAKTRPTP